MHDGVEHSVFASGRMPRDRATEIGPIRIEVVEPLRVIRFVVDPNEHDLTADLVFRARTVAIEEPRQTIERDAKLLMDYTRLTQWGTWEGEVRVGGTTITVDPARTTGTRDRSWGVRGVGVQVPTNAAPAPPPQIFWLWAPLHFDDVCTHLAMFERADGERWLESALIVPVLTSHDAPTWGPDDGVEHLGRTEYSLRWRPGRREIEAAVAHAPPQGRAHGRGDVRALLHVPYAGDRLLAPGLVARVDPRRARGRRRVDQGRGLRPGRPVVHPHPDGVPGPHGRRRTASGSGSAILEQLAFGDHRPTGLKGIVAGYQPA